MSETFVIADPHFDHPAIIRHCHRPWLQDGDIITSGKDKGQWVSDEIAELRTKEMNADLVANWNATVPSKGAVIYIIGDFAWKNHRKWINALNGKKIIILGNHDKMSQLTLSQFSEVHQFLMRKICGRQFVMFHYPMKTWASMHWGAIHLYGHCHGRMPENDFTRCCDVGVDVWGYKPIHIDQIIAKMDAKKSGKGGNRDELDANMIANTEMNLAYM